jgi:hypothetical protein
MAFLSKIINCFTNIFDSKPLKYSPKVYIFALRRENGNSRRNEPLFLVSVDKLPTCCLHTLHHRKNHASTTLHHLHHRKNPSRTAPILLLLLPQCQPGRTIDLTYEQLNEKSKTTVFSRTHHPIPQVSREPWVRCTARFPQFQMQQLSTQLQGSGEELARILLSTALQPSNIQLEQQGMYVSPFPLAGRVKHYSQTTHGL